MEVTVWNRQRFRRVDGGKLRRFAGRLASVLPAGQARAMGVCLVGDRAMRALNRRHRAKDATTDVLSFPAGRAPDPEGVRYLGDILISVPQAARQARGAGHALDRELRVLVLHGYLHLLGYDHERDDGEMLRLQRRLERSLLAGSGR
ncbi:MAG TPA: rRNA maturation RNase YbeY [Candidatus Polarisedimenticolaceae bacterium]|nr:rRNA maturation RNase YbeY [Candidatus Polarisedimenticolaceae bacterium]